jgi:hypothetical protein
MAAFAYIGGLPKTQETGAKAGNGTAVMVDRMDDMWNRIAEKCSGQLW